MHRRGISFNSMEASGPPIEPLNLQHSSCHLSHRVSRLPFPIHSPFLILRYILKSVGTDFALRFCNVECGFQRRCAMFLFSFFFYKNDVLIKLALIVAIAVVSS